MAAGAWGGGLSCLSRVCIRGHHQPGPSWGPSALGGGMTVGSWAKGAPVGTVTFWSPLLAQSIVAEWAHPEG